VGLDSGYLSNDLWRCGESSRYLLLCVVVEAKSRISFPFNIKRAGTNHFENPYDIDETS
jgi:hypothetical protein